MKAFGTVSFTSEQRSHFMAGDLHRQWAKQYPKIFDADDIRLVNSQPKYHFYEWLAAIIVFNATGYLSLDEKWGCIKHKHKELILAKLLSAELIEHIRDEHLPDLLCYNEDYSDFFFVEVKGPNDRLRVNQQDTITLLEKKTGKPAYLLEIKKKQ